MHMMPYFKMYGVYCSNHPKAVAKMTELLKKPDFANTVKICESDPRCRGLKLSSFLIKPIQRICKYPILFRELLKNCNSESEQDYSNLVSALKRIEEVTVYINEGQRLFEKNQRLIDIQNSLDTNVDLISSPSRKLIKEGAVKLVDGSSVVEGYLFVFNDLILITKQRGANLLASMIGTKKEKKEEYDLKGKIPVAELRIINVADTAEVSHAIELAGEKKSFVVQLSSSEGKSSWLKELKPIKKDFQKKQYKGTPVLSLSRGPDEFPKMTTSPISSPVSVGSSPGSPGSGGSLRITPTGTSPTTRENFVIGRRAMPHSQSTPHLLTTTTTTNSNKEEKKPLFNSGGPPEERARSPGVPPLRMGSRGQAPLSPRPVSAQGTSPTTSPQNSPRTSAGPPSKAKPPPPLPNNHPPNYGNFPPSTSTSTSTSTESDSYASPPSDSYSSNNYGPITSQPNSTKASLGPKRPLPPARRMPGQQRPMVRTKSSSPPPKPQRMANPSTAPSRGPPPKSHAESTKLVAGPPRPPRNNVSAPSTTPPPQ
eukprot:TRINITY_DN4086_c0_g1_i3.p1 TRINITY_DN4086_c0_g1~~TRINITY_DN4086_c0_g1_i3.p1  ORF type:complete len:539 (+),score=149.13 TRINITY_DN4086_c0_g1_i3:189-1805(+)